MTSDISSQLLAALANAKTQAQHAHTEKKNKITPARVFKHLAIAGGMVLGAILLHHPRLTARNTFNLISSDPKDWARVFLGVGAVNHINKAFNLELPPWLSAIESVAVINPLTLGFSGNSFKQFLVMAPLVAGAVQGASWLSNTVSQPMEKELKIPSIVTRLGIAIGMAITGFKLYPFALKTAAHTGILGDMGKEILKNAKKAAMGAGTVLCVRGCCSSIICLTEIGEMSGAFLNWFKSGSRKIKPEGD